MALHGGTPSFCKANITTLPVSKDYDISIYTKDITNPQRQVKEKKRDIPDSVPQAVLSPISNREKKFPLAKSHFQTLSIAP